MKKVQDEFRNIVYWIGLGITLIAYAHSNFATSTELKNLKDTVDQHADKDDVRRLERKIDGLTKYLLENR